MTKRITITLTEDQHNHLIWLLDQDYVTLEGAGAQDYSYVRPLAFNRRLKTILAKAKTS